MIVDPPARRTARGFVLPGGVLAEGSGEEGGYSPEDLRSAYKIPRTGGAGQTVAVIMAFGYPEAETDLAVYRSRYELPPCTKENGCLRIVNQSGGKTLPPAAAGQFATREEQALDMDMVSAMCPECHILLVQTSLFRINNMANATNTAARLGATEISNSYGWPERLKEECRALKCSQFAADYDHPGIPVLAGSGDNGYENGDSLEGSSPEFPASAPGVIAVGGTSLTRADNARGWTETAWEDSGSGCSVVEPKPAWQADPGCSMRTTADVAAVADWLHDPVSIYGGLTNANGSKWHLSGGTSAATPLLAGIIAHANSYTRSLGAEMFYRNPGMLFDVTEGRNGECATTFEYLCTAEVGYDGPTGWGTPDGVPNVEEP
jgi:subtilase family serine protease